MRDERLQASLVPVESIHARIKRLRRAKGLSQEQLAAAVGVKYQSVQEWEREGGTAPTRKRQAAVAKCLGVTPHVLMTGEPQAGDQSEDVAASPQMDRLARAFSWLMAEEQDDLLKELEAKAEVNKQIAKRLGPRFRIKPDQEMLDHLKHGGDFPPGTKKRPKVRRPGPLEDGPRGAPVDDE
jgi:transcriptional regulator with XRE-family HTH domain